MSSTVKAQSRRVYPHFDDLVEETKPDIHKHASIKRWVEEAQANLKNAEFHEQVHRADDAYLNFMKAAEIVSIVIPAHKEYPTFASIGSEALREYKRLQQAVKLKWDKAEYFRSEIKRNNELHGTQRKSQVQKQIQNELSKSSPAKNTVNSEAHSHKHIIPQKKPPPVPAKPASISGQPPPTDGNVNGAPPNINSSRPLGPEASNVPTVDDLTARLDRLRAGGSGSRQFRAPPDLPQSTASSISSSGPRGRPLSSRGLQISPKLDTSVVSGLPRPPSPTYSPARNSISPARSIPRKPMPTPPAPNLTNETTLSPSALSSYLSRSKEISLLVLDVRERTEYDEGHIPARATICIEPLQLRKEGVSGDELEEKVFISPANKEHELFSKRHTFDLVVYHDQSTASDTFLNQRTSDEHLIVLQRLHRAICQYTYSKPLKRPPVLLAGGIKAWTDLFGPSSLVLSDSRPNSPPLISRSAVVGLGISSLSRATPPISDNRGQRNNKELLQKTDDRNLTDGRNGTLNINIEDEQAWLAKLQNDREPLTISVPMDSANMDVKRQRRSTSIVSQSETYPRTIEQFFQQFPASPSVQQSMMTPIPGTPVVPTPSTPGFASKRYTIIDHPFYGFTDVRNPDFNPPPSPVRPPPALPRRSYKGESEKPPIRPSEPPLPPKETPVVGSVSPWNDMPSISPHNFGTVGLANLGNTCYMNSVIQCMNGSIPLARYFLDGSYKLHLNKENSQGSRGDLAEAFATLVKHLWEGRYKFIQARSFKDICGRLNEMFDTSEQQDAQEFLSFLLDNIHEDLNPRAKKTQLKDLTPEQEAFREQLPVPYASFIEWERYTHRNYSVVVNWFQGQYCSRVTCMTCNTRSTTYTPFMVLSIPIPHGKKRPTLEDCFAEYCKEEVLTLDNAWRCPRCRTPQQATKKLTITRLPVMFIVHFKRFTSKDGSRLGPTKMTVPVQFPLRQLKLDSLVPAMGDGGDGGPPGAQPDFVPAPEQTAPFEYDLYGVVNHMGSLSSGHYTSLVRDKMGGGWREFDDSKVTKVAEEMVSDIRTQQTAYVLFWVRNNIM